MALTVSELAFVFGADQRGVDKALAGMDAKANATAARMDRSMGGFWREETSRVKKTAATYDKAGKTAGEKFKAGFQKQLAGLAIGAGAVMFLKDSINAAGDLAESGSKLGVVYGDAAGTIEAFSKDTTRNILLTQQQALDAASTFGIYGKSAGLAGQDLAKFGLDMTSLASDMSSFFNTDTNTAVEAIGSALRGEAEPIRAFGVLLDDATLRARALKMGLIETTKDALTPQQKVLSAYQEILAQTADAQGDAARTSDGYANSVRRLQQKAAELQVEVGQRLIPAVTGFVNFLIDDGLPAMEATGGAVMDLVHGFQDLPDPVKAAAAALVALKLAEVTGLTGRLTQGVGLAASGIESLRLRTMLAADEFRSARANIISFNGNVGTIDKSASRTTSTLRALGVAGQGAGAGLKAGLSGAMGILGGPWGVALLGATAAVTYFWQENQKAEQRVDDMTAALDAQTGALTKNNRELAFKALQESGAIDLAKKWGLSLDDVTEAAMGNSVAQARVAAAMDAYIAANKPVDDVNQANAQGYATLSTEADKLRGAIGDQNDEVSRSRDAWRDHAEAMGDTVDSNDDGATSFRSLRDRIRDTRDAINDLADAEQERRVANLADRQDRLALIQQMQATREEATNSTDRKDIADRIAEARASGAEERRGLRQRLADVDPKSKTAARDRAEISRDIAKSTADEAAAVAELTAQLKEYDKTLNPHTKAGQANLEQLYALSEQWNNSEESVRNAKGMYDKIRQSFIDSAVEMGATSKRAEKMADDLLLLPESRKTEITTPGMEKALRDLETLRARVAASQDLAVYVNTHVTGGGNRNLSADGRATAGPVWAGRPYKVNEVGPELFVPKQDGRILSARDSARIAAGASASGAMSPVAASSTRDIDYSRLGSEVATAIARAGGLAPLMKDVTIKATDMADVERHARKQSRIRSGGGVVF